MGMASLGAYAEITLPRDTVRPNGMYNAYVIYGASPTASDLDSGLYVLPPNIVEVSEPDSELEILYAHDGSISHAASKTPVFKLFPEVESFVIDGDTLSRQQFDSVPVALLSSVTDCGDGVLKVDIRPSVHDLPVAFRNEQDEEYVWIQKHTISIPALINDFFDVKSYPDGTYFSVDYYLRSRKFAVDIKPKVVRLSMYGDKLHLELFTVKNPFLTARYIKNATLINVPDDTSIANIMSLLPSNTQTIIYDGTQFIALPIESR